MQDRGYHEYICERGHYSQDNRKESLVTHCPYPECGQRLQYHHKVDASGMLDPRIPSRWYGPKTLVDQSQSLKVWEPASKEWVLLFEDPVSQRD